MISFVKLRLTIQRPQCASWNRYCILISSKSITIAFNADVARSLCYCRFDAADFALITRCKQCCDSNPLSVT